MTGSITDFDNDSNYSNQIKFDMSMIKPKKTRNPVKKESSTKTSRRTK